METALARYRSEKGLSLEALGERFKVDKSTILRWERGHTPVPAKRLAEIEAATGIPRTQLRPDIFRGAS